MLLVGGVVEEDYYQDTGDKQEAEQYDYTTEVATPTVLQYEAGTMKWGAGPSLPSPLQVGLYQPNIKKSSMISLTAQLHKPMCMNSPVVQGACGVQLGSQIFVTGGKNDDKDCNFGSNSVLVLDRFVLRINRLTD